VSPDELASQALLNCLIREVGAPEDQAWEDGGHLVIRLPRSAVTLRARLRRPSAGIGPRTAREVQVRQDDMWRDIDWRRLADLIAAELTLATGTINAEFVSQVRDGHAAFAAILAARAEKMAGDDRAVPNGSVPGGAGVGGADGREAGGAAGRAAGRIGAYLDSEQALVAGHRFHPSPKTRGAPRDWLRYAPEAGARFPLRFLAVREEALAEEGDGSALDRLGGPVPPPGTRLLPAHPWQFQLVAPQPWLRRAMGRGLLTDLGEGSREVVPTASVRTVYDPVADVFCKFSLNVRITNCLRKLAWYELPGAVVLTQRLAPVFAELGEKFPGTVLLGEPGYRTAALACRDAYEGLAVIVREGVRSRIAPDVTPLLAASLTEPAGGLFDGRDGDWLLSWWQAYVRIVAPPVLDAFFGHGVVLEPHLQNVLVGVDGDGRPVQAVFRDLEGTKLVSSRHGALLAGLPPGVARGLAYDARRGWDRVAYCLLVNHLAEVAAAIADRCVPAADCERELWRQARQVLTEAAAEHGWPPELRAVLAGVPLPGKANLRLRWYRDADREAEYIPVPNPLRGLDLSYPDPNNSDPDYPDRDYRGLTRPAPAQSELAQSELAQSELAQSELAQLELA
jgi:siderophore synthetase component